MEIIMHNGIPCVKAKVYRLPTKNKNGLAIHEAYDNPKHLWFTKIDIAEDNTIWQPRNLYITTDEDAEEKEWCIDVVPYGNAVVNIAYPKDKRPYKQLEIIATDNPKLRRIIKEDIYDDTGLKLATVPKYRNQKIPPKIPQSFIEEYCKAGGIDEVLVEVECLQSAGLMIVDYSQDTPETVHSVEPECIEYRLKLNLDNTIIIHPVEEKMYDQSTIDKLLDLVDWYDKNSSVRPTKNHPTDSGNWYEGNKEQWLKEN